MLKMFSRMKRTRNWLIVFFAVVLVVGLVVAGVYNRTDVAIANPFKSKEVLASVRGDDITVADFTLRKTMRESQFGGQFTLAQLGFTGERLLDEAIGNRIAVQEAERLNLKPSDEEVRAEIVRQFGGDFDMTRYRDVITRNYGSVALFEEGVRRDLAVQKLRAFITAGAQVSEKDVQEQYMKDNTAFDVLYVPVTPQLLAEKLSPSDEELRQYFEARKTDYRFLEPQKKIRYLFINQEKVGEKLNIPDEELRKEYDSLKPENKQAGVRVQQIVMKVARPELDQDVQQRASQLVQRLRGDEMKTSEEKFAEAARGNSEDAATAKQGGWLPSPVRRNPNRQPPQPGQSTQADLLQNTLDMQEGQVSEPQKAGNAYYIFRRGPAVPKTFEDARKELLVSLRNRRSYNTAQQIAQRAQERLKETKDAGRVAQELAGEANMSPSEMVKETGFVKPGDDVAEIGSSPQFEEAIAPLNEQGQVGERVGVRGGFAVPMLLEKRDPRIPEFEEVRDRVAQDFRNARAKELVEQRAKELAGGARSPEALKAAAEQMGLKAETETDFRLGRPLGTLGADESLDAAIYALKPGEVMRAPVKVGDSWAVAAVTRRQDADMAEFGKQRDQLMESALADRRSQIFDEFIASVRRRLEQEGEIKIYPEVLARIDDAGEPPSAFPSSPITIPPPAGGDQ